MIFRSLEETPYEIEVPNPEYGYTVSLVMQIKSFESGFGWDTFDNGVINDARILKIPGAIYSENEYQLLTSFLNHQARGRKAFEIELEEDSGFFPFGPDLGQSGTYRVHMLNRNSQGMQIDPWKYFVTELSFILELGHGYEVDYTNRPEGNLGIGQVSGLMFPQNGFKPKIKRGLKCDVTNGRYASAVDVGYEKYETEIEIWANLSNAAKLVHEIQTVIRGNNFVLSCGNNYYPFDIDKNDSGNYYCKLISDNNENITVEVKHIEYDQFRIPLKIWLGNEL